MNDTPTEARSVTIERDFPHPPNKIWRALTQPHLIEEWLMKNDFEPVPDHRFQLRGDWGNVDCTIRTIEQDRTLSYSWDSGDLESVVTWTLTPTDGGTRLRMEQTGFKPDQPRYYQGARMGWPRHFDAIEQVLARMD
ncbi:SRPBCC family protein [Paracoccus alkanivorans]|uniref:SRPBCC domain-containing protein n=1 Tax=Paracoccus alkanivorans TaxID=2116655 RepID=A0A3M0MTW7_9RHOB|nr:SRPBCC domain-containing protein [Paracoccus alkanivorans]RMC34767.1 SRPBCC domain-containing protein [Paracoccus alkanivorans]